MATIMKTEKEKAGDCPEDIDFVEEEESGQEDGKVMKVPQILAALQNQRTAEMIAALPPSVRRRIRALKKLQFAQTNIEADFFKEVHALECKYHKLYEPMYEKRSTIINASYEPNDEECDWHSDEDEDVSKQLEEKAKITEVDEKKETQVANEDVKGIPDFWITIFKNVPILSHLHQDHDEPILKHLIDIKTIIHEEPMGFTLEFYFSPNEYFTDKILTKHYDMKCTPDEDDPFGFEGPEIYKCRGCTINWNKGKNVTVKTVKKKQKHKSRGVTRTVTKTVQTDSFFNFFSPPQIPDDVNEADVDDEVRELLTTDFEIGHYIRERIVPRAILYYTGEGIDEEDYEDFEEEEDEDEDEEEDDEEGQKEKCKQQ